MTADLPIAVTCLAFQHLFAVAVKGVLLVFVVAVWFQVFTSPRAGRQLFSSPFAHYSFTNGFIWLIFKIDMKIFPAVHRIVPFVLFGFIGRSKADGAENVIRVKATVRNFPNETNMSVITEDGSFYTFNVKYAAEPLLLNVEMCDFIHDGEAVNRPNNAMEIYLQELGNESPRLVRLVMKSVHGQDKRRVKHIGCKRFGVQYLLKGLYAHGDLLYFHTEVRNSTHVPFDVDFVIFKIVDKKIVKRTAMQEQVICPLRAFNYLTRVDGKKSGRTVFALPKFTLPDDKKLVVEMYEKQGGRHQVFEIENEDLVRAETINELKVR